MAFSLWTWACDQLKPTTGQRTIWKKSHFNELYTWARDTFRWPWSVDAVFDSCQLTITWMSKRMSTIKLNTDCFCFKHLASNARSLQEKSQSERACYCSHIIKRYNEGLRDWQNVIAIRRFCNIEVLFHIFYYYWGKENRSLYRGLRHIDVPLY